jgi:hypothetical protein
MRGALGTGRQGEAHVELILAIVALVPITYLFINRGRMRMAGDRQRSVAANVAGAAAWGVVYALPLGYLLGLIGILIAVVIAVYAYLR